MLCSPQPEIKLHHLIPDREALIDTARARRVSPGVDVGQDSSLGLTHRHGVQRSAWGNSLHQHQPKCHKAPSADSTLTFKPSAPAAALTQRLGVPNTDLSLPPLSSKHLIKELNAAVNSEAKKESKPELSWEAGEHS